MDPELLAKIDRQARMDRLYHHSAHMAMVMADAGKCVDAANLYARAAGAAEAFALLDEANTARWVLAARVSTGMYWAMRLAVICYLTYDTIVDAYPDPDQLEKLVMRAMHADYHALARGDFARLAALAQREPVVGATPV